MTYTFADVPLAVFTVVDGLVIDPALTVTAYRRLQHDFAAALPAAHVRPVDRTESGDSATDLVAVDVYAGSLDDAMTVANAIVDAVSGDVLWVPGVGLLEDVTARSGPVERPYASDAVVLVTATFAVNTRGY